ncbi:MAG: phytanoyl-CoA dioxygenase family protein [Parachlamydiales bacterium]|nr:phytanoyl-CoA dioxygenase family protein [Parachlamydiales bacterium]
MTPKEQFESQGFYKIERTFRREFIQELAAELLTGLNVEEGIRIHNQRYIVTVPLRGAFNSPELYANPNLLPLFKEILGPECILASVGAVVALPGASDQHIHSDYGPLFSEKPDLHRQLPTYAITVGIPLVDIDVTNGPTKIWPGSHRTNRQDERVLLCGEMGDCYFWDYRTLHAGGSNFSDAMRPLLYLAFTRRWFRDFLNPDKLVIDEETIPQEYRALFPIQKHSRIAESEADFKRNVEELFSFRKTFDQSH